MHPDDSRADRAITTLLDHSCVTTAGKSQSGLVWRVAAAFASAFVLSLALIGSIIAHGALVDSDPAEGSALTTTPYTLTATFAEAINPEASTLFIETSSGVEVARGAANADDFTMMTAELPHLPDGVYTVRWTTVTPDDAGTERGTFTFTVAAASTTPAPTPVVITPGASSNSDILMALVMAGIAIGVVVAFVFFRGRR